MSNNETTTHTHLANVQPFTIAQATGIDAEDAFIMIASILRSDFNRELVAEWVTMDMEDVSYSDYILSELDNMAQMMREDEREMMNEDMHFGFVTLLRERAKLIENKAITEDHEVV